MVLAPLGADTRKNLEVEKGPPPRKNGTSVNLQQLQTSPLVSTVQAQDEGCHLNKIRVDITDVVYATRLYQL